MCCPAITAAELRSLVDSAPMPATALAYAASVSMEDAPPPPPALR
jgi:hypothetical protein